MTRNYRTDPGSHVALTRRSYPHGTRARYNAERCRCTECRAANAAYEAQRTADPRVPAAGARVHIEQLQRSGVGLRAISDATDISRTALKRILLGQPRIKSSVATRLLSADAAAIADSALVDAAETQRLLRSLIRDGYTKGRISTLLGNQVPALQYRGDRVLAKTELRVRKLHALLLAEGDDGPAPVPVKPRERILLALRFFEAVTAQDLFDAMNVDGDAYMQALHRLVGHGVQRLGERKPFRYRVVRDANHSEERP